MSFAIEVKNLKKSFGDLQAVQDASFKADSGEVLSLLGPNGAGKSTTISMLSGLLAPSDGDAFIMGHSVTKEPEAAKKSLGVVPLYDIGRCFKETLPTVRRAMAMDGGSSSDLRIVESLWAKDLHSQEGDSWKSLFSGSTNFHIPLPTVIGVSPR